MRDVTNNDGSLALNEEGQVQFEGSLQDFLKTDQGKKIAGATGGVQGAKGTYIGESASSLYDEQGNAARGRSPMTTAVQAR